LNLKEACTATLNSVWAGTKNEEEAWRIAMLWCDHLGDKTPLKDITHARILGATGAMRAVMVSNGTMNRRVAVLSKVLHLAQDMGALDAVPKLPRWREAAPRERYLSPDEEDRLLESALLSVPTVYNGIIFLIQTGCRVGEMFALTSKDIDEHRAPLLWHVRAETTKTNKARVIPLTTEARQALRRQQQIHSHMPWGSALTRSQFNHAWEQVRKAAGLEDVRLHDLRHTFASRLVQRGVSIYTVQHLLGHTNVSTTMRYAHLDTATLEQALTLDS
jgi:integrase